MSDKSSKNASAHGRQADAPQQIPAEGWKDILWRLWGEIGDDRVMLIAAGVTYYLLLAMVPTLTAFVSIYGLFNDPATVTEHISALQGVLPWGAIQIIEEQLTRLTESGNTTLGWTLLISIAIALWSSSAGVKSLFEAMNIAYDEKEKRNFFKLNALALGFTLAGIVAAVFLLGVVVVVPGILAFFHLGEGFEWLIRIGSFLVLGALLLLGVSALYRFGPSRTRAKWRWITPGAVLAVVVTAIASILFSWYVSNFGDYNATYGSLGALIGFLTWMWISVTILLIGAELNSEIEHQTARDSTVGEAKPMGSRGAEMADKVGKARDGSESEDARDQVAVGTGGIRQPPQRKRFSPGALAFALPASLVLSWATRRNNERRAAE